METSLWHERYSQQAAWTESLRRHLYERVGVKPGWRILEVGCGTGALLPELAAQDLHVFGIDINLDYLIYANDKSGSARLAAADGYTLPFHGGTFDACLCHFVLLWTKRPLDILREMRRVTRPGGIVLALAEPDYGGRLDYPQELQRLGELQMRSLVNQGAQPYLGRQLRSLLVQAGLIEVCGGVIAGEWAEPPDNQDWEMEWRVLQDDIGRQLSAAEWRSLRQLDDDAWQSRQRVLYVPTFYAYGRVQR